MSKYFASWPEGSDKINLARCFGPSKVINGKKSPRKTLLGKNFLFRKNSIQIFKCAVKTRQQSLVCALDKRIAFQSFLKCSNVRFSFREKFSEFSDVTLDGTVICPNDKSNQVNLGCLKCSYNRLKICQYLHFN